MSSRLPVIAVAALAMLIIASCSTAQSPVATPSATPSSTATASTTLLADAVERTFAAGTMRLSVEVLTTVDGVDDVISGEGSVAVDGTSGQVAWQSPIGDSVERVVDGRVFVQVQPPDGSWLLAPEGTPTSAALAPLRGVAELRDQRIEDAEQVRGEPATRVTGWLPAAGNVDGLGLNPTAAEAVATDEQASVDVAVWVGSDGMVRRVMRTLRTSLPISAATFVDVLETGAPVDVREPSDYATAT